MKNKTLKGVKVGRGISAFIGPGSAFEGKLTFEGVIRLDGRFTGEIHSSGTLIIGRAAHVDAEIVVDSVVVSGEVHGNIRARNRVELHSPAKLYGNITSPILIIDEGVLFDGSCEMDDNTEGGAGDKSATPEEKAADQDH